jgi:hypothetical protein
VDKMEALLLPLVRRKTLVVSSVVVLVATSAVNGACGHAIVQYNSSCYEGVVFVVEKGGRRRAEKRHSVVVLCT